MPELKTGVIEFRDLLQARHGNALVDEAWDWRSEGNM
jgi:hypothetical protein